MRIPSRPTVPSTVDVDSYALRGCETDTPAAVRPASARASGALPPWPGAWSVRGVRGGSCCARSGGAVDLMMCRGLTVQRELRLCELPGWRPGGRKGDGGTGIAGVAWSLSWYGGGEMAHRG
ncbi:hypothetical protein V490_05876 [Pseudogymnoascus sp. VKM F-3557]|nr:hypothetical protein V490_05876 [Pseudogymnoascus sp. VKM F-3557]